MAGTVIADVVQAASTSQLNIKNGVALTPPTVADVNGVTVGTFCRAWISFNGTGTPAIKGSFNISSITDNGVGNYTLNFTNAMPSVNYSNVGCAKAADTSAFSANNRCYAPYNSLTTSASLVTIEANAGSAQDCVNVCGSIFN